MRHPLRFMSDPVELPKLPVAFFEPHSPHEREALPYSSVPLNKQAWREARAAAAQMSGFEAYLRLRRTISWLKRYKRKTPCDFDPVAEILADSVYKPWN